MNKKGQVMEIAFVLFLIVSVAICAVLSAYVYNAIKVNINDPAIATAESTAAYNSFESAFPLIDNGILFIVFGLTIGLVVTSFLIPTHPAFFVLNVIGFIMLVFIGAVYSNTFASIAMIDPQFENMTNTYFDSTAYIVWKLPYIAAGLVLITSIVMFAKGKSDGAI